MTTNPTHDPRPLFTRALDQTERQVAAVRPDEMNGRTPCTDYDVRALLGHVVSVLHQLARASNGGDMRDLPAVAEGIADDGWVAAFTLARAEVERLWADDGILDRTVALSWAALPGRAAIEAYTHEFTAHSWDLAHATGRLDDLDPALAERALTGFTEFAPAGERGEDAPFDPVVPVSGDADVYTRLAAYLGRRP